MHAWQGAVTFKLGWRAQPRPPCAKQGGPPQDEVFVCGYDSGALLVRVAGCIIVSGVGVVVIVRVQANSRSSRLVEVRGREPSDIARVVEGAKKGRADAAA